MADSGAHGALRKEGAETPPDVSYRFVVSFNTLQAARAALQATARKKGRWARTKAFLIRQVVRLILGLLILYLWFKLAVFVYSAAAATQSTLVAGLLALATVFITWLGLMSLRVVMPRLQKSLAWRAFQETYFDNEFVLEGRKSHLWFDDRFVGAMRGWLTFVSVVEFEQGMWLLIRKRGYSRQGYLISKESLPGSCSWEELKAYIGARIAENATAA